MRKVRPLRRRSSEAMYPRKNNGLLPARRRVDASPGPARRPAVTRRRAEPGRPVRAAALAEVVDQARAAARGSRRPAPGQVPLLHRGVEALGEHVLGGVSSRRRATCRAPWPPEPASCRRAAPRRASPRRCRARRPPRRARRPGPPKPGPPKWWKPVPPKPGPPIGPPGTPSTRPERLRCFLISSACSLVRSPSFTAWSSWASSAFASALSSSSGAHAEALGGVAEDRLLRLVAVVAAARRQRRSAAQQRCRQSSDHDAPLCPHPSTSASLSVPAVEPVRDRPS